MTSHPDGFDPHQLDPEMARIVFQISNLDHSSMDGSHILRGSIDLYLKAVLIASNPWAYGRHFLWQFYTDLLYQHPDIVIESDKKACQNMLRNEKEPALYRASAASAIANLFDHDCREVTADYYRQVIEIGQSIAAEDVDRPIITTYEDPISTVGRQVKRLVDAAKLNLRLLTNRAEAMQDPECLKVLFEIDPVHCPQISKKLPDEPTPLPRDVQKRLELGGNACDCCGKTVEQLGVVRLHCCSFCKSAYYCGHDCQRKQWKAGHRSACRKPGEIKALDWMRIQGLQLKPELNGRLVMACRVDPANQNRWIACFPGVKKKEMSLAIDKLVHIRPAK